MMDFFSMLLARAGISGGGNVYDNLEAGVNITIEETSDGKAKISASGEVSSEDTVARADIAAIKDGENLDSFGDVETALATKADTSTTYTKTEVDTALSAKANSADVYSKTAVDTALSAKANSSDVYSKSDIDTAMSAKADKSTTYTKTEVDTALGDKVDKETDKGLSTNDYTDAEKTKLDGIAEGAEVNVQSDWTQTTITADDYIKNKPTLGTAAAKNATDTYNATGTDVTTGKAVAAALATLPEPMVFKGSLGTGGTITTLPTASSSNKGYVYKVITAGTYASQSAKIGDTFISDGSVWVLIPSGDEPSGTVTSVGVVNGGGLTISGSPITSSGTITVGHQNSVTAKTSSSVKKFKYDAYGHITGSSELSTAESNALASGIDSTKVAKIATNETNIGKVQTQANWNTNNGVKNLSQYNNGTESSPVIIPFNGKSGESYIVSWSSITSTSSAESSRMAFMSGDTAASNIYYATHGTAGSTTLTLTADCNSLWLYAGSSYETGKTVTANNFMIRPATIEDSTFGPYSLPNTKITPELIELVDNGAKNKIFVDKLNTTNANGVTYTINSNGTITANGTPSGTSPSYVVVAMPDGSTYKDFSEFCNGDNVLSGCPSGGSTSTYRMYITGTDYTLVDYGNGVELTDTSVSPLYLIIYIYNGYTANNLTFKPMICSKAAWDVSKKYTPYAPTNAELYEMIKALQT